jgi:hypothetical protein
MSYLLSKEHSLSDATYQHCLRIRMSNVEYRWNYSIADHKKNYHCLHHRTLRIIGVPICQETFAASDIEL